MSCAVCRMKYLNPLAYFDGCGTSVPVTVALAAKNLTEWQSIVSVLVSGGDTTLAQEERKKTRRKNSSLHCCECSVDFLGNSALVPLTSDDRMYNRPYGGWELVLF
jgi:hypothetical protein